MWVAGALALLGSLLLAADSATSATASLAGLQGGDAALMLAALLWSIHIVRVGCHTARFPPLPLAIAQLAATAAASCVLLIVQWVVAISRSLPTPILYPSFASHSAPVLAWLLLFYPAFGPWAGGTWLQYEGQSRKVGAGATSIILATDPLWTALFAWLLLGAAEQQLGGYGLVGAVCILAASLLAH